jgi:MinD superfamily P-loop ATPase
MKSIVILSGKGGVGKSSITASLAIALSKNNKIVCADCDVDASNLSLLFGIDESNYKEWNYLSTNEVAVIEKDKCTNCKNCVETCHFNAINIEDNKPIINKIGCEGCGACELICPTNAIKLEKIYNAKIGYSNTKYDFKISSAQLEPGNSGSGKVVFEVKEKAKSISPNSEYLVIDSSAGVGCPVISSVNGSDYAIIVTEPTPSGFSDLKKAIEIVNHFKIKKGIIINKYNLSNKNLEIIENYAKQNKIEILTKIPFDKSFVKAMNNMIPIIKFKKNYEYIFDDIKQKVLKEIFNEK